MAVLTEDNRNTFRASDHFTPTNMDTWTEIETEIGTATTMSMDDNGSVNGRQSQSLGRATIVSIESNASQGTKIGRERSGQCLRLKWIGRERVRVKLGHDATWNSKLGFLLLFFHNHQRTFQEIFKFHILFFNFHTSVWSWA